LKRLKADKLDSRDTPREPDECSRPVASVIRCVEAGDIRGARVALEAAVRRGLSPDLVAKWRRVLAPPTVTRATGQSRASVDASAKWLRERSSEYRGRWVALRQNVVVDSDASRAALYARLKAASYLDGVLLVHIAE
jgi:hypothetical protein